MKPKILPLLLMSLFAAPALAVEPFVIKDIRVEGIQRTEAGTVFRSEEHTSELQSQVYISRMPSSA